MKTLTPAEIASIQATLAHARVGRATLAQLAAAHDLAEDAGINGTIGELRFHIRHMVKPPPMQAEAKGLLLGVASGILTHYLLDSFAGRLTDPPIPHKVVPVLHLPETIDKKNVHQNLKSR